MYANPCRAPALSCQLLELFLMAQLATLRSEKEEDEKTKRTIVKLRAQLATLRSEKDEEEKEEENVKMKRTTAELRAQLATLRREIAIEKRVRNILL